MDAVIAEKYSDIVFEKPIVQMLCEMIKKEDDILKVLQTFLEDEVKKMKGLHINGVTKKQLMEIRVMSRKLDRESNSFVSAEINISKHRCNNIISFLDGAMLIYHDPNDRAREKPIYLTKRGVQICTELLSQGILRKPNI